MESALLYGAGTWIISKSLKQSLDGCYTKLLRAALKVSWRDNVSDGDLNRDLPPISATLREHRLKFCGHCWRTEQEYARTCYFENHCMEKGLEVVQLELITHNLKTTPVHPVKNYRYLWNGATPMEETPQ